MKRILVTVSLILMLIMCGCAKETDSCHIIVFHTGCEASIFPIEVMSSELSMLTLPDVSKEGKIFNGWYTDVDCENKFDVNAVTESEIINLYADFLDEDYSYTVTVTANIESVITFSGGNTVQIIDSCNPDFDTVEISENLGYTYLYYEIEGEKCDASSIKLSNIGADIEITVYAEYATYELPIINIDTEGQAVKSKTAYTDMSFSIENCEDEECNYYSKTGGIRLRGNTTSVYDKKPYRIKFDKKLSLFGCDKAKSWVLLADYLDPSTLHNQAAFAIMNTANLISDNDGMQFTPTAHKVNVYMNGEFLGLYTVCEQVQENDARMNIELDEITADMTELKDFNFFVCLDKNSAYDDGAVEDETYITISENNDEPYYFEIKYPEKSQFASEDRFVSFIEQLKEYLKDIIGEFSADVLDVEAIKEKVNINSLLDYAAIDQIMGERDHIWKSFNLYYVSENYESASDGERGKLNFGPIWDYDWALYTEWTGHPNEYYTVDKTLEFSNVFFKAISKNDELYAMLKVRFNESFLPALESYIEEFPSLVYGMRESLSLNNEKWYSDNPQLTWRNILFFYEYLNFRMNFLSDIWSMPENQSF